MSEFDRLVDAMVACVDQLAELTLERLRERFPAWEVKTAFSRDQVFEVARGSLKTQLSAFRRDVLPKSASEIDAAAARTVARVGELDVFANGHRAAQLVLWETWFALVEDSTGLGVTERRQLLSRGSDFFFRYADLLGDYIATVYREERAKLGANNEQRRFGAIKALLDGEPSSTPSLDLDLDQHHLGLLAWGRRGEDAARALATALARPLLIVATIELSWWGWISGQKPFEPAEQRALERFAPPAGAGLALGLQEFGARGFRATHRQAQRARLLAPAGSPTLTRYADFAVEALASENEQEARSFVERELGAIGDESATSQRIRETLSAYFAAEHNAASAAATLGVHQQTVANRLRAAEERLGHSIGARRVELEVALRLRASLNGADS
jgi:PucR-like helix-turn-helix protein/diguanylate cyclase with GGDEF domain